MSDGGLLEELLSPMLRLGSTETVRKANDRLARRTAQVDLVVDKQGIDLLEAEASRLGEEDVEEGDEAGVRNGEDDVEFGSDTGDRGRGDHNDDEVEDPVGDGSEGRSSGASREGHDLGGVEPVRAMVSTSIGGGTRSSHGSESKYEGRRRVEGKGKLKERRE